MLSLYMFISIFTLYTLSPSLSLSQYMFHYHQENRLTAITGDASQFPPHLEILKTYGNDISDINPQAFSGIPLKELLLSSNNLQSISDIIYPSSLTHLSADFNRITSISVFQFRNPNFNSLRRLYLSFNPISSIDSDAFSHLTSLRVLTLMAIHVTSLDFSLPSSLRQLILSDTPITSVSSHVFSNLQDLKYLYLDFNDLTSIDGISFPSSLRHLYLEYNPISSIPSDAFSQLTDLRTLSLSGTQLTSIDGLSLPSSLETLDLHDTRLTHLPMTISSLTNLASLRLDRVPALSCSCGEAASFLQNGGVSVRGDCEDGTSIEDFVTQCPS